jgi:CHAD domain-containing protein
MKEQARPGLEPLLNSWKQTIDTKRSKLTKHLRSEAYQHFKNDFNIFLQVEEKNQGAIIRQLGTTSRVRDIVPVLVYSQYAAVKTYETVLSTATVTQLHALRIEIKKFRYTLEYFREILGESAVQAISELKVLQDHLGELHDADVACELIRSFLKTWDENQTQQPIPERLNPELIVTYMAYMHAERYRLMISFPELWGKFNRPDFRQNLAKAISLL